MSTFTLVGWLVAGFLGLVGCGLFAGLETGVYRLNRVRMQLSAHEGHRAANIIRRLVANPARLLATLLIATNISTNISTSALGHILLAQGWHEWQVILGEVLIMTPILMVFAEILPKDFFAVYADQTVYRFARLMDVLQRCFMYIGILPLINGANAVILRLLGLRGAQGEAAAIHPRRRVGSLVKEGLGKGLISHEQSALVERVLGMAGRTVADEMIPWQRVTKLNENDKPEQLWELAPRTTRSRFPLVSKGGKLLGVISLYDALLIGKDKCPPLKQLARAPLKLEHDLPLQQALRRLKSNELPFAIVVKGDTPIGIVTVKDVVEPITGELYNW